MRKWIWMLMCCLVVVAGCSKPPTQIGGKIRTRDEFIQTAISLSPSTTELVPGKAYMIKLLGRTASCNYPETAKQSEVVMNGLKPNFDRIAQLRPNIVVYDASLFSQADVQKLEQLKIKTFGLTGNSIKEFTISLYELGAALGEETNFAEYVAEIEQAAAAAKQPEGSRQLKVALMMPGKRGDHYIAGTKSFLADVVKNCGGTPVGPDSDKFEPANIEQLLADNPDIIVSAGPSGPILNDPRLRPVNAVKSKFVAPFDEDRMLRRGARVPDLIRGVSGYLKAPTPIPSNG